MQGTFYNKNEHRRNFRMRNINVAQMQCFKKLCAIGFYHPVSFFIIKKLLYIFCKKIFFRDNYAYVTFSDGFTQILSNKSFWEKIFITVFKSLVFPLLICLWQKQRTFYQLFKTSHKNFLSNACWLSKWTETSYT